MSGTCVRRKSRLSSNRNQGSMTMPRDGTLNETAARKAPPMRAHEATVADTRYFGLTVSGDSMEPRYHDGDTIFVDGKGKPCFGDVVVVVVKGGGSGAHIVEWVGDKGGFYFFKKTNRKGLYRLHKTRAKKIHREASLAEMLKP